MFSVQFLLLSLAVFLSAINASASSECASGYGYSTYSGCLECLKDFFRLVATRASNALLDIRPMLKAHRVLL